MESEMLGFAFKHDPQKPLRVLCLGAHSDDIEIGCAGTIRRLVNELPTIQVHWVVLGSTGIRTEEALSF